VSESEWRLVLGFQKRSLPCLPCVIAIKFDPCSESIRWAIQRAWQRQVWRATALCSRGRRNTTRPNGARLFLWHNRKLSAIPRKEGDRRSVELMSFSALRDHINHHPSKRRILCIFHFDHRRHSHKRGTPALPQISFKGFLYLHFLRLLQVQVFHWETRELEVRPLNHA
jgi:hypothetical protein